MNIVDVLILLSLMFAAWKGYRKGLMASLFKLIGYISGLLGAFLFGEVLMKVVDKSFGLTEKMIPWLMENSAMPAVIKNTKIESIPFDRAEILIENLPVPDTFQGMLTQYITEIAKFPATKGIHMLGDALVYILSSFILMAICFTLIYFVVSHFIGSSIPKGFKKLSPGSMSLIDRLAGTVLGLIGGFISIAIAVAMMFPVVAIGAIKGPGSPGLMPKIAELYQGSVIVSYISEVIISIIS